MTVERDDSVRMQKMAMGAVLLLAAAAMLIALLVPEQRITGTNNVMPATFVAKASPESGPLCVAGVTAPEGTGGVRLYIGTYRQSGTTITMTTKNAAGKTIGSTAPKSFGDGSHVTFELPPGDRENLTLCLDRPSTTIAVSGEFNGNFNPQQTVTLGDAPVNADVSIEYVRPGTHSALSQVPTVFERASLFRPGWVGPWTFYLVFLCGLLLIAAGWLLLLRSGRLTEWPVRRMIVLIAAVAFANAALWAIVTPAFNTPDEFSHYTYIEALAHGELPQKSLKSPTDPGNSYLSSSVYTSAIVAVPVIGRPTIKEPWSKEIERDFNTQYERMRAGPQTLYGLTPANAYSPLYYLTALPFYELGGYGNIFDQLLMVRLWSALLLALSVVFVMLFVAEMLPRQRWAPPVAGLAVAFEPMAAHLGGGVSNDNLMVAACTATLWLAARVMRRGPTFWNVFATTAVFAVAMIAKPTSFGLVPALAFAILIACWRSASRLRALGVSFAAAVLPALVVFLSVALVGGANTSGVTSTAGVTVLHPLSVTGYLSYLWQWYLPSIGSMDEYFVGLPPAIRVFFGGFLADFNALDTHFPNVVYAVFMLAGIALFALCLRAVWQRRDRLTSAWPIVAFPALAVLGIALLINTTGYILFAKDGQLFQQGRYFFPAIAVFALFVAAGAVGAGKRFAVPLASAAVISLAALNFAGMALSLSRFYL